VDCLKFLNQLEINKKMTEKRPYIKIGSIKVGGIFGSKSFLSPSN